MIVLKLQIFLMFYLFINDVNCDSFRSFSKASTPIVRKPVSRYIKENRAVFQEQLNPFQDNPIDYYGEDPNQMQSYYPTRNPDVYKPNAQYNDYYEQQKNQLTNNQPVILSHSNKIVYKPSVKPKIQPIQIYGKRLPTTTITTTAKPFPSLKPQLQVFKSNDLTSTTLTKTTTESSIVKTISSFLNQKIYEYKDKLEKMDDLEKHKKDSKHSLNRDKIDAQEEKFSVVNKTVNDDGIIAQISERLGIKDEDGPPAPLVVSAAVGGIESLQSLPQLSRTAIIKTLIVVFPFVVPLIFVPLLIISIGVLLIPIARYNHFLHHDGKYFEREEHGRLFGDVIPFDIDFRKLARGFLSSHDCVERVACEIATRVSKRTFLDGWILRLLQRADKYWANRVFDALRKSDHFRDCHQFCCSPLTQMGDYMRASILNQNDI